MPASSGPGSEYAYRRVWEINQLLSPKPHDFISTGRFYVKEGPIVLWDDKTRQKVKRYLFLFNDLLLFTIPKKKGKKFQLVIYMTLRSPSVAVEIVDNSSYNNEFRLHARRKSFIFFAESVEDRKYWVKQMDASIKGTHPEENHTKTVHQQAKELTKKPVGAAAPAVHHNDDDAEMTIYSSGSRDDSEEDALASPVHSGAGVSTTVTTHTTTIDFNTANPFASTNTASPFMTTPNPFMTGQATSIMPGGPVGANPTTQFGAPAGAVQLPYVAQPQAAAPFATVNPFMSGNPGTSTVTTTYTQQVVTGPAGAANPFATNTANPFATNTANPFATTPATPFATQPVAPFASTPAPTGTANPFATNTANPFMTYQ